MSSDQCKREVSRTVSTETNLLKEDTALAASMCPIDSEIVDADVVEGELKLTLEGPEL